MRAWSTLEIKSLDEDKRIITGIASSPITDRQDDIVEPLGAKFALPIPLLWQHRTLEPIGQVIDAAPTDAGVPMIAQIDKGLDFIDRAWELIKRKLVRGLSIGFRPLEYTEIMGSFGRHYKSWEWLELSVVTIAANQDASISSIKALDLQQARAAFGTDATLPVVRLGSPRSAAAGANGYVIRRIHRL